MSFCKFSTEVVASKHTMVDNLFITEFLPTAPDVAVKVYLFGLQKCNVPTEQENNLKFFSETFGISEEDILSIFLYWQDQGLVQVLSTEPFEVRYLPIRSHSTLTKKWSDSKFSLFNIQIQEVLSGRMITPNEYNEYYTVIEAHKIEPDALVAIAKYCTELKGPTVGHAYITTVARIWASEGVKTIEAVREKLISSAQTMKDATQILGVLGSKRQANIEEQNLFIKWTDTFGFDLPTLNQVAKMLKKQKKSTFDKLDWALTKYYEAKMFSFSEIEEFESCKESMNMVARKINKALGVWYESLDAEISECISKWIGLGFNEETLVLIASYCFKKSIRTLQGMNDIVLKFHKLGVISLASLGEYIEEVSLADKNIKALLEKMGATREVNQWDRTLLKCWTEDWKFSQELIDFAVSLSQGKSQPMQYANKILGSWLEKKVSTIEEAKRLSDSIAPQQKNKPTKLVSREYTTAELSALFDNLEEIDI